MIAPLPRPLNTLLTNLESAPDFFKICFDMANFSYGVKFFKIEAGRAESRAAAPAPNNKAVPVASSPVWS